MIPLTPELAKSRLAQSRENIIYLDKMMTPPGAYTIFRHPVTRAKHVGRILDIEHKALIGKKEVKDCNIGHWDGLEKMVLLQTFPEMGQISKRLRKHPPEGDLTASPPMW